MTNELTALALNSIWNLIPLQMHTQLDVNDCSKSKENLIAMLKDTQLI
jgi:hypothetical protein